MLNLNPWGHSNISLRATSLKGYMRHAEGSTDAHAGWRDAILGRPCWPVVSPLPYKAPHPAEVALMPTSEVMTCLPLLRRAHNFAELGDGAHWEQLMTHLMEAHQPATSPTDKAALDALPRRSVRPEDAEGVGLHHPQEQQASFAGSASSPGRQGWGRCVRPVAAPVKLSGVALMCRGGETGVVWATHRSALWALSAVGLPACQTDGDSDTGGEGPSPLGTSNRGLGHTCLAMGSRQDGHWCFPTIPLFKQAGGA